MCGIAGIVGRHDDALLARLSALNEHRGPDEEGILSRGPVGIVSRRLAIVDLAEGHQPMRNERGDRWISFNGEIFNAPELRRECEARGYRFHTDHSDTEVVLALYELEGDECLQRLNGMFAFVVHDEREGRLFGARDRFGIKPLYWTRVGDAFAWASELRTLLAVPGVRRDLDRQSLFHYVSLRFVPGESSIFEGIHRLQPGHAFVFADGELDVRRWYRLAFAHDRGPTRDEWVERVREGLRDACRRWSLADVPVAASLSGGLDSSAVVALLAGETDLRTYSLGFTSEDDAELNELPLARALAERYGTDHHELVVESRELLDDLLQMVWALDEPYGGGLPSWYVFKWMAGDVKVGLTGSGGDELFGNYRRFVPFETARLGFLRRGDVRRYHFDPSYYFSDAAKAELLHGSYEPTAALLQQVWDGHAPRHTRDGVVALDMETQLADEFLLMTDRFSMAHSLEARTPFLDHEFAELVASIPPELRTSPEDPKGLLRAAVAPLLTPGHVAHPKRPFIFPIARWLRGELRPLAERLLSDERLEQQGLFRPGLRARLLDPHVRGERDEADRLWPLLMFQLWHLLYVEEELSDAPGFGWDELVSRAGAR
jgi:asparagine synthase (glutamine-hydrolysing)